MIKYILLIITGCLFALQISAQKKSVESCSGTVFSENTNEPLPGTTVMVKGTGEVAVTGEKGAFRLNAVPAGDTLIISRVGYATRYIPAAGFGDGESIEIRLTPSDNNLQEVVVSTGYQEIPRERATGSFVFIDNKTLNEQVGTNILQRINGVASGVLFRTNKSDGTMTHIGIRGLSSINGPLDPLIVLDGFIYEGDINNINPNDVQNITILKDAAATSIWGARAGNGVIVIRTKSGHLDQKLQVGFNANVIVHAKPDLFSLPRISSSDYIDVEQFLFNQGFFDNIINRKYLALTPAVEILLKRRNGLISAADSATQIDALKAIDSRDQALKYFYTNAVTQQYAVNFRGGGKKNAYTFSAAYDKTLSELSARSGKLNIGVKNTFRPFRKLTLDLGVYYTNGESVSGKNSPNMEVYGRSVPYLKFADGQGNALPVAVTYRSAYTDTLADGKLLDWKYYPLEDGKHDVNKVKTEELYTTIGLKYKFTSFLDLDLKYQYQRQHVDQDRLFDEESYHARDMINQFTQYDRESGEVDYIVPTGGIRQFDEGFTTSNTLRGQLNFNYRAGDHAVSVLVGSEIRQKKGFGTQSLLYGYTSDPVNEHPVDFVNYYPTIITGGYNSIGSHFTPYENIYRFASFYGTGSYTYKNKYIFSASARKDGANIFGLNANDKWNPLWSTGVAWKISNEPFFTWSFLPELKMRLTYGYNGNLDPRKTAKAVGSYEGSALYTDFLYMEIETMNNPDLKWEKTGVVNVGFDFATKNRVLSGSLEYYHKRGTDLYGPAPIDYTTGPAGRAIKNVANMEGEGIDFTLDSRNIDRGFKWTSRLLFDYYTDKTTAYFSESASSIISKFSSAYIVPVIGKPLFAIAAFKWGGLDGQGNPQGVVNGKRSTDYEAISKEGAEKGVDGNIIYIGHSSPVFFGSLINRISWKGISLSANIAYKLGYYFRKPVLSYYSLVQHGVGNSDFDKRWKKPGDETKTSVPSFIYPVSGTRDAFYSRAEINVLRADNFRLQYVNLSYSLDHIESVHHVFSRLEVYLNMANLGILWRANGEGFDPDYPGTWAPESTYALGIRADF